jgi:beta-glucosidase
VTNTARTEKTSTTEQEDEATSPAAMVLAAEDAVEHLEDHAPTDHDAAWGVIREGVTEHERGTFQALQAGRRAGGVSDKIRSHDPADGQFLWMTAIEGSTIPQMNVDQMDWTQHYNFWKQDLRRVRAELGVKHLRVSPPWYKLNPGPGIYDWGWWDEYVEYAAGALGFELMVDLVHFGTPLWMLQQFGDPDFAPRLAEYAGQFARRYRGAVRSFVPINEPYITALFSGDLGCWPPFWSGQSRFPPMLANVTRGIVEASQAIRAEQPDAVMMYVDTTENSWSPDESLGRTIEHRNIRRFIAHDLAMGMVDEAHPLTEWLLRNNMREDDLRYFRDNPAPVDLLGLDYYPQSEAVLRRKDGGGYTQKDMMGAKRVDLLWDPEHIAPSEREWPIGFYGVAREYQRRYNRPIFVAETNWCGGPIEHRLRWMDYMLEECKRLRAEDFPLVGFCWWGAYDHMDWGLALRLHSGKVHPVGLWNLKRKNWVLRRVRCPLFDRYRWAIHHTESVVGPHPLRADSVFPAG